CSSAQIVYGPAGRSGYTAAYLVRVGIWRGRTCECVRRATPSSRLISISRPSRSAGVNRTRAPTSAPSSRTTVPGPDGPRISSVIPTPLGRVIEAAVRNPEVGEPRQRGGADVGRGQPVGELGGRRVRGVALVDQRVDDSRDRPELDRDHVVGHPAAVREPA